jgi:hypothetical protein
VCRNAHLHFAAQNRFQFDQIVGRDPMRRAADVDRNNFGPASQFFEIRRATRQPTGLIRRATARNDPSGRIAAGNDA